MKEDRLRTIRYIRIPDTIKAEGEGFSIDPDKRIPVQLPQGASSLRKEDISLEAIISGMLTVIAYDEGNQDFQYFRSFVLAADPTLPEKLIIRISRWMHATGRMIRRKRRTFSIHAIHCRMD